MNYRDLPDAPESVKYHGGYDPDDPPTEETGMIASDCGHDGFEEETTTLEDGSVICVNCVEDSRSRNTDAEERGLREETGASL